MAKVIEFFRQFRQFKSRTAFIVASVYCIFAILVVLRAIIWGDEGLIALFMIFMYWPISLIVLLFSTALFDLLIHYIPSLSIIYNIPIPADIYFGLCCIIIGTVWYYYLVKTVMFLLSRLKHMLFNKSSDKK